MSLLDVNGQPVNSKHRNTLVNDKNEEVSSAPEAVTTTKDIGLQLCNHMLTKAQRLPSNDLVNKQFDILVHCALNILAHRIVNVGLGMEVGNTIAEWEPSRAFAYEKEIQEALTTTVEEWKTQFFNGDLQYMPAKAT